MKVQQRFHSLFLAIDILICFIFGQSKIRSLALTREWEKINGGKETYHIFYIINQNEGMYNRVFIAFLETMELLLHVNNFASISVPRKMPK